MVDSLIKTGKNHLLVHHTCVIPCVIHASYMRHTFCIQTRPFSHLQLAAVFVLPVFSCCLKLDQASTGNSRSAVLWAPLLPCVCLCVCIFGLASRCHHIPAFLCLCSSLNGLGMLTPAMLPVQTASWPSTPSPVPRPLT